jgi:hypothetical protein
VLYATHEIDEYEVMYSANVNAPRIWLKSSNKYIGQLIFNANGSALPPDNTVNDQVYLFYHLDDYHNIIDLLRNEQPVAPAAGMRMESRQLQR